MLENKYILIFSKDYIIYTEKFRKKVIMDLSKRKSILDIFEDCGLNLKEIGLSSIKANKHNWSKELKKDGSCTIQKSSSWKTIIDKF